MTGSRWPLVPLRRVADVVDCAHVTAEFVDDDDRFPVASIRECGGATVDLSNCNRTTQGFYDLLRASGRAPRVGDLLFVRNVSVGLVSVVPPGAPDFAVGQETVLLRRARGVSPSFLRYALSAETARFAIESVMIGSTFRRINVSAIRALPIPLPPLEDQRAIADYLDRETARIDELVTEQRRLIEIQSERLQSLVGRAVFGLDKGDGSRRALRTIGDHRAVEPLLERIPSHWRVERFKAAMARMDDRNTDLSFAMMSLKSTGEVVPRRSMGERQEPDESSLPRYLVARVDDLVVNPMWLIGGAIGVSRVNGAVSPDYRVFRSVGAHHPRYLHHLLRSRPYVDQYLLYTRAQTTFDRRVQQPDLDNMPLPIPPMAEQVDIARRIDASLDRIDEVIGETEALIKLAQERRAALITAAVTGQIDVQSVARVSFPLIGSDGRTVTEAQIEAADALARDEDDLYRAFS